MERTFNISNDQGIHARPATELVQKANAFFCDITLTCNNVSVDMKSIMGVLSLGVTKGSTITIVTTGVDAEQAMYAIGQLIAQINQRSE